MSPADLERLRSGIRDVPDFPEPGILFKDITPVLSDAELFQLAVAGFVEAAREAKPDKIVGIDARGFIFGGAVAHALGLGFVPIRKKGKLPGQCGSASYALEYGEAVVEMHRDALRPSERVVLIDDLLATGGTAAAASRLIQEAGAELTRILFMIELRFLNGRAALAAPVQALITY
jgi:adenine phosphoribosyltransferase